MGREISAPTENQTPAVQPVAISVELSRLENIIPISEIMLDPQMFYDAPYLYI
jgi:hypothetical protein